MSDVKKYIWDDPYLFKSCPDGIVRRCVFGKELHEILEHCHTGLPEDIMGPISLQGRSSNHDSIGQPFLRIPPGDYKMWNRLDWADKLDDALWAFRTAYKAPIRSTPFRIVYGKACHLPLEMEHKAY
ncbi:reverse transcriptase domain-containing protein [Tanacetum coccineum]